jgi:DNA-damage-inducible protein J
LAAAKLGSCWIEGTNAAFRFIEVNGGGPGLSDAFRLMMVRIAKDKALPFEPLVPNAETIEAMKAARRGDLVVVGAPDKLLGNLNAED